MTTKTVAVQLIALTSQYQKSMGAATASTAKLQATSAAASKGIGSVMGPQIALAGAVVAGAAVKMALDWEDAFTKIGAITSASQGQVDQWKEEVMTLAGETAQAPRELADALYFLASAGLDANEVMPALEASARASAVGLGETGDIARITANAMNAYSASGLTATQVTDTLVAAVREGTAEPDEFAGALGRILPIASKAGISFDQVAASLSALSNIGLDVNEGVTAMRGVIQTLLAPTAKAKDALDEMGISTTELRESLAEKGLIATLRMLDAAAGGNIDTMNAVIGNVRALTGAFGLTQQEAAKVDAIFRDVANSSGALDDAFNKTEDSAGHKLRQALVDIQVELIKLGDVALPSVATGLGVVAQGAENARIKLAGFAEGVQMDIHWIEELLNPAAKSHRVFVDLSEAFIAGKVNGDQMRSVLEKLGSTGLLAEADMAKLWRMLEHTRGGMKQGSTEADRYRGDIDHMGGAAADAAPPVEKLGGVVKDAATDLADAEEAADGFAAALDALTKVAFDVEEARLNWHQGLIDLNQELGEGAKILGLNSEAGIANREAMKGQLENALAIGIAMREKGVSESRAAKITNEHVRQVRDAAVAAGFAADEVDAYIRTLNLTPKDIRTLIRLEKTQAQAAVSAFIGDLNRIPNIKDVLIRVRSTGPGTGQQIGHSGGVVGNLPRYHGGGEPKSDEQLVLARKGEHILTDAQYRARPASTQHAEPRAHGDRELRVGVRLDRRRFTTELDHDATYAGRWSA